MRITPQDVIEHVLDELALGELGENVGRFHLSRSGPRSLLLDYGDAGRFTLVVEERAGSASVEEPSPAGKTPHSVRVQAVNATVGSKISGVANNGSRCEVALPPAGYQEPNIVWLVEYGDEREPGTRFQAGAFTSEAEAQKLLDQLSGDAWRSGLALNMVPVHRTVQDWLWDR